AYGVQAVLPSHHGRLSCGVCRSRDRQANYRLHDWVEWAKKVFVNTKEEEAAYDSNPNRVIDWSNIFFKLAHYCNLDKHQVWELTIPQLNYYLKQCHEHIDFTVKVSTMGFASMFGGGGA